MNSFGRASLLNNRWKIELSLVSNPPMFLFYKKLSKLVLPNLIGSPLLKVYSQMILAYCF